MSFPLSFRAYAFTGTVLALVACSSQAGTTYLGEPLATLSGTIQSESDSAPTGPMDAALVWAQVNFSPNAQFIQSVDWVGESAPVVGQFPASFTLNVYQPPPTSVLIDCASSSAHIAVAFVVAVPPGSVGQSVAGEAQDWMLLYLDSDEPAGWSCIPDLGFTFAPTKGFHLLAQVTQSLEFRAEGACYPAYVEAPAGLEAPIAITLYGTTIPWAESFTLSSTACSCLSTCETKGASCGAPASETTTDCKQVCENENAVPPTASQISCIESADCDTLEDAFKTTGTVCGIGLGGEAIDAGPPDSSVPPPSSKDAGAP
jgi:hypothetical protein